jgi:hypothetical protein
VKLFNDRATDVGDVMAYFFLRAAFFLPPAFFLFLAIDVTSFLAELS